MVRMSLSHVRILLGVLVLLPCLAQAEWSWIWAPGNPDRTSLRRTFEVSDPVRDATLWFSCDNVADVFLNGVYIASGTDWNTPVRTRVTPHLKAGSNVLQVEARNEGGIAGLVARLRIRSEGKPDVTLDTDTAWEARPAGSATWSAALAVGRYGAEPWGDVLGLGIGRPLVVAPEEIQTLPGFTIELVHAVPRSEEGSWVALTVDPKGNLYAADQHGAIYHVTPAPLGSSEPARVERLATQIGGSHGLLYAFDSLYVMVNEQSGKQGLWRLRDTNGDGRFDEEKFLRKMDGGGEHGPHAIVLSPDGKSLYVIGGNHTKLPEGLEKSRAPRRWAEDQIVPRLWDANGHARGILAPGGYICRTDPEGREFELISYGYRNSYDLAFTTLGDPVTFDSDMEWDAGMPWYRPTRINLATSGSDKGWRSGSGKWPESYPDSLPALANIGPGSPTGVEAGRNARFPARYQEALYAADWTYGTLYALHLTPKGAAYETKVEEFLSGKPLPLTDLVVNPHDGALYFAIGGRRTQSALYRVIYTGSESTAPIPTPPLPPAHQLRRSLEAFHQENAGPEAVAAAWPYLGHADRWIRYAARVAIEHQPIDRWLARFQSEYRPWAIIEGAVALARTGNAVNHLEPLLTRLSQLNPGDLDDAGRLAAVRAIQLAFLRLGPWPEDLRTQVAARLDLLFPSRSPDLDRELAGTLIALGSPSAVPKTLQLMVTARDEDVSYASDALLGRNTGYADAFNKAATSRPNQQQLAYAYALRTAERGWTPALRRTYFSWFPRTAAWQGGNSFRGFIENFRQDALRLVNDPAERAALDTLSSTPDPTLAAPPEFPLPKGPGRDYSLQDVLDLAGPRLSGRNFENGRAMYHSTACFSCHRFNGTGGGLGPDLTGAGSRYTLHDLVENIVDPSKVISDQYGSEEILLADGSTLVGRAYEEDGKLHVVFDPRNPTESESVALDQVRERHPYPVSLMPAGLLNSMNSNEVLDLLAYLQSGGNPQDPMFRQP